MPSEKFYAPDVTEEVKFAHGTAFSVAWGGPRGDSDIPTGVFIAGGVYLDESGVDRLIATLKRARRYAYGRR